MNSRASADKRVATHRDVTREHDVVGHHHIIRDHAVVADVHIRHHKAACANNRGLARVNRTIDRRVLTHHRGRADMNRRHSGRIKFNKLRRIANHGE